MAEFEIGEVYRRRELHEAFGGGWQGGISASATYPIVLLFTGSSGIAHGYNDRILADGTRLYYGEGQTGDMQMLRGNKAIRDHKINGKELHLFEVVRKGFVKYLGEFECLGYFEDSNSTDRNGHKRTAIVFQLAPIEQIAETRIPELHLDPNGTVEQMDIAHLSNDQLLDLAIHPTSTKETIKTYRLRSAAVREYVFRRAKGICEGCEQPAPFERNDGSPYLEAHHVYRLADGGPDDPRNVVAICPNCHREAHYSADAGAISVYYKTRLNELERSAR